MDKNWCIHGDMAFAAIPQQVLQLNFVLKFGKLELLNYNYAYLLPYRKGISQKKT